MRPADARRRDSCLFLDNGTRMKLPPLGQALQPARIDVNRNGGTGMLTRQSFSEASSAALGFDVTREPDARQAILTALGSGKVVRTGELSNTPDDSIYRKSSRVGAWLEEFFLRCAEGHIARAARVDLWPWP